MIMKQLKTVIKNTLMVDNEELENSSLTKIFNENGIHLDIISTKHDYVSWLKQKDYDCVLLYSDLPDNLTLKIIEAVKGNYPWVIVVILLVNQSYEKVFNFVRLGVDDFILKPFSWDDIEKIYRHYYY